MVRSLSSLLFVTHYIFLRPHMSLKYKTPVELPELEDIDTIQENGQKSSPSPRKEILLSNCQRTNIPLMLICCPHVGKSRNLLVLSMDFPFNSRANLLLFSSVSSPVYFPHPAFSYLHGLFHKNFDNIITFNSLDEKECVKGYIKMEDL